MIKKFEKVIKKLKNQEPWENARRAWINDYNNEKWFNNNNDDDDDNRKYKVDNRLLYKPVTIP